MGEKQLAVSFLELSRIGIVCKDCGAGVVIPIDNVAATSSVEAHLENSCPGCGKSFQMAISAVRSFRKFYEHAKESGQKIEFNVKIREENA